MIQHSRQRQSILARAGIVRGNSGPFLVSIGIAHIIFLEWRDGPLSSARKEKRTPEEYLIVGLTALLVSGLTLFSGFGLGILLMPAFALFFPVPIAIAATALVHLADNIFKVSLVGRNADWGAVATFAIPGAIAAIIGAGLLNLFAAIPTVGLYWLGGMRHEVTAIKLLTGTAIAAFAVLALLPRFRQLAFGRKYLPVGGLISGFLGGLAGNQGALRTAFLVRAGLAKEAFIATGAVSAVIVDVARLVVYGVSFSTARFAALSSDLNQLVFIATVAAFLGTFIGARLVKRVTLRTVHRVVGVTLVMTGASMAVGLF